MMADNQNPPPDGRVTSWVNAVKGLTFANVAVIAMLGVIAVPLYAVYRVLNDDQLMDKLMSSYHEFPPSPSGCTVRELKPRSAAPTWTIATGFAYQGTDKWLAGAAIDHKPSEAEIESYCESLKLITESWRNIVESAP
jgi:hypothetical protein